MTYITGGDIQASDYNTFATLAASMNEVFADLHPGATTIGAGADYGYGQTPALSSVSEGSVVGATEWAALYQAIRKSGQHQNTTVVPPLPGTNPGFVPSSSSDSNLVTDPASGGTIIAYNTPSSLANLITTLRANRHNVDPAQMSTIAGTSYASASNWTNSLIYEFQVDFGSWDNARYFFNSAGKIVITSSYPSASTPVELAYQTVLQVDFPLSFNWTTTTQTAGGNVGSSIVGFYGLTTSYQETYKKFLGDDYYTTSYVSVDVKLNAAAGTDGLVDFKVNLIDNDPTLDLKTGAISFQVNNIKSAGAIVYPGPAVIVDSGGFTYS